MKKTFKKTLSFILIIAVLFSIRLPAFAGIGDGETGVLLPKGDGAAPKEHQALTMTVDSVASTSSLQAFCVGWNFTFSNSNGSISVYVPLSSVHTSGGSRTYTFPLTTGWTLESTGIAGAMSIRDLVSNKTMFDNIIKAGCTVTANACVEKYSYSSGTFSPLGIKANTSAEIDSKFSEFSAAFKTNTKVDYYNLTLTLASEPSYTNTVHVSYWDQATNTKMNITQPDITVTDFGSTTSTFQLSSSIPSGYEVVGRIFKYSSAMPSSWADYNSWDKKIYFPLASPNVEGWIHILLNKPAPPAPNTGSIYIKCIDSATNTVVASSTISNVPYSTTKTITAPSVDGYYNSKGSYKSFSSSIPDASNMQAGVTSQSVTLTSTNGNVYLWYWYDKIPAPSTCTVTPSLGNRTVKAGENLYLVGSASDSQGHAITDYYWDPVGATEATPMGNMLKVMYSTPGVYDVYFSAVCSAGNGNTVIAKVTVQEPAPAANIVTSGIYKENRKIGVDASTSYPKYIYPIDWTKTTWNIEPDLTTTAKWEMGVRLADGSVRTINQTTDQSFLKGQSKFDFQARYAGQYKVTLTITDTNNNSGTVTKVITVVPDQAPIANFYSDLKAQRDQQNPLGSTYPTWGKAGIHDSSYSPDYDTIKTRIWGYRYNSNNNKDLNGNHNFTDETTVYKYTGSLSDLFYQTEGQRLVVDSDNDLDIELWNYDVGGFAYELTVIEDIPESETIKELLLPSDYRTGYKKEW